MDTFVCASNTNQTQYFFFEFMDEPWKDVLYGGVEVCIDIFRVSNFMVDQFFSFLQGWWGVFTSE